MAKVFFGLWFSFVSFAISGGQEKYFSSSSRIDSNEFWGFMNEGSASNNETSELMQSAKSSGCAWREGEAVYKLGC